MELQLCDQEKKLLLEILEERNKNLIHEIARTDHREFKHELQPRCLLIEGILKKVQAQEPRKRRTSGRSSARGHSPELSVTWNAASATPEVSFSPGI